MPKLNLAPTGGAVTPRSGVLITPRVPGSSDVAQRMTPRVPKGMGLPELNLSAEVTATPPVSPEKMMTVKMDAFAYLTKKLVHLSVLLEQDTI